MFDCVRPLQLLKIFLEKATQFAEIAPRENNFNQFWTNFKSNWFFFYH